VESSIPDSEQMARFLVASVTGSWNFHVSSCGLKLSDDAVRVAVASRLGCRVCVAHKCRCEAFVDTQGQHGLICKQTPSMIIKHSAINDITARSLASASIPTSKAPTGLTKLDSKHPDSITLVP